MMLRKFKNPFSSIAILIIAIVLLSGFFSNNFYRDKSRCLLCDIVGYYNYLPSFFIRHDVTLQKNPYPKLLEYFGENELRVNKMTVGIAYLYAPFFFAANAYVNIAGIDCDEYDEPYSFALFFSSLFYSILGFIFLRKTLLLFFPDISVALTIISVGLATNIIYYIIDFGPMSHIYSFFLFSIFIYLSIKWHDRKTLNYTLLLGLVGGLLFIIRPINLLMTLFFLFYKVVSFVTFKERIATLFKNYKKILIIIAVAFVLWIPQLFYWKNVTGNWVFYSYQDEGFFWLKPMTFYGLFCYRNGWLVYTPIMVFSILGMLFLKNKYKDFCFPVVLYFIILIYVTFCWWCWWYSGYGNRAMIDSYPLLAIPLTAFYGFVLKQKWVFKIVLFLIISFFIFLNFFQLGQYRQNIIDWDGMNKKAYWAVFLKNRVPGNYYTEILTKPDYDKAVQGKE